MCKKLGYAHKDYWAIYTFSLAWLISLYIKNDNSIYNISSRKGKEKKTRLLMNLDHNTAKVNIYGHVEGVHLYEGSLFDELE